MLMYAFEIMVLWGSASPAGSFGAGNDAFQIKAQVSIAENTLFVAAQHPSLHHSK